MSMSKQAIPDGVRALPPREQWSDAAKKVRDKYALKPDAPIIHQEFGFMEGTKERWRQEGLTDESVFGFEPGGTCGLGGMGWCEAPFVPEFEKKVLEDRGEYEVVQDHAGRSLLCFKGRRQGFMPEYIDHPVKDQQTWEEKVKWRLDPATPGRLGDLDKRLGLAVEAAGRGERIVAGMIGGYMYLRSLIGPEDLLYALIDQPELIHDCMRTWLNVADAVTTYQQQRVTLDEVFLAEDICYNAGALISPDMMREFLFPYYQQLLANVRGRQLDRDRHLYLQIDTDGNVNEVIDVYRELGVDAMSPFEVASGCDVVEIGRRYPDLVMSGGIDKRVLAEGAAAIDEMVERIIPTMRRRGGYTPTCDHAVPTEVPLANYLHYRKRCLELGG